MSKRLRVGVVGCGQVAREAHLPSYHGCARTVELVAVADILLERAQECAREFDVPHAFASYDEMLAAVDLDAVSVCVPNKFHAPATVAALEAGCHVLCEKPAGVTVEEAETMAAAALRAGRVLTFGFHLRHGSEAGTLRRFCDAGELGEIYAARAVALRRRGIPGWGAFTNKELQGGGALMDIGAHVLDLALYLMGWPEPEIVLGATHQNIGTREGVGLLGAWDWNRYEVEDMVVGMVRFRSGASLVLEASFAANIEHSEVMQVSLMGEEGGADLFPLRVYQEKHQALLDITPVYLPTNEHYRLEIEHFVECCVSDRTPLCTSEQAVAVQKLIAALYESALTGSPVTCGDAPDRDRTLARQGASRRGP